MIMVFQNIILFQFIIMKRCLYWATISGVWNLSGLIESQFFPFYIIIFVLFIVLLVISCSLIKHVKSVNDKTEEISDLNSLRIKLERKNRDIIDSLIYAQRIQEAMLPSEDYLKTLFKDVFLFFKPRDIVSGDFYWVTEKNDKIFLVAADCTGHGVPGALISVIGMDILDKAINGNMIDDPSDILEVMDKYLEKTFNTKRYESFIIRDGMDLGLCVIDRGQKILRYAGAFLSLYLLRNNILTEFKGDKFVLGAKGAGSKYKTHLIPLEYDDTFYLFSDGYPDQFGGSGNKKFMYRRFRYLITKICRFPMVDQKTILEDNIKTWMGAYSQVDDMMVIGFRP